MARSQVASRDAVASSANTSLPAAPRGLTGGMAATFWRKSVTAPESATLAGCPVELRDVSEGSDLSSLRCLLPSENSFFRKSFILALRFGTFYTFAKSHIRQVTHSPSHTFTKSHIHQSIHSLVHPFTSPLLVVSFIR